jgi:hypothetical protein
LSETTVTAKRQTTTKTTIATASSQETMMQSAECGAGELDFDHGRPELESVNNFEICPATHLVLAL